MDIDDLKPFWQAYKAEWKEDNLGQMPDIQTIITQNPPRPTAVLRRSYVWLNSGIYLLLILCVNGC
jgi:hypothetical protein